MSNEEWRPAVGYEGRYSVSSLGRVRSEPRAIVEKTGITRRLSGRLLSTKANRGGYLCFAFCVDGKKTAARVHTVVAQAFLGPKPSAKHEVAHFDGNPKNNQASNLRWDTRAGNFADKLAHGTHNRGERHPNARLTNADVAAIRESRMSPSEAAHLYGISRDHAARVLANDKRRNG